jgi:hypothetical protein
LGSATSRGGTSLRTERRQAQAFDATVAAALRSAAGEDAKRAASLLMGVADGRETRAFVGPELDKLKAAEAASGFSAALAQLAEQYRVARKSLQTATATALLSSITDVNSRADVAAAQRLTDAQLMTLLQCTTRNMSERHAPLGGRKYGTLCAWG